MPGPRPHRPGPRRTVIETPTGWSSAGEAIVRDGRRTLAIWQGIPGERAEVSIVHSGQNLALGRWVRAVGATDPGRREVPCPRCGPCAACPLMHLRPDAQAAARLFLVRDALAEYGFARFAPTALEPSPDGETDFRHVVKLAVGADKNGAIRVGALARRSRDVIPISECIVATPALRRAMSAVSHHIRDLDLRPYDPVRRRGLMRTAVVRQSRATGEILITLVATRRMGLLQELADRLVEEISELAGVHLHINDDPGNAIFAAPRGEAALGGRPPTIRLAGREAITEELAGMRLTVGPTEFFQTNPSVADGLVRAVVDAFSDLREHPVVDLYCGVGAFTVALAGPHGWAFGIEANPASAARARENAHANGLTVEFAAGEVGDVLPELAPRLSGRSPVVVVDPARAGLDEPVIDAIVALEPARIAYVSCNPRALARDLDLLGKRGMVVRSITAWDMFPQTAHVELLAVLEPEGGATPPERRAPRRRIVG